MRYHKLLGISTGRKITGRKETDRRTKPWNKQAIKYHDELVSRVLESLNLIGAKGDVIFKLKKVCLGPQIECYGKGDHDILSLTKEDNRYVFTLGEARIGERSFRSENQISKGFEELTKYWKNYIGDYKKYVTDKNIILDTSQNYEILCRLVRFTKDIFSLETNRIKIDLQEERKLGNLYDAIRRD